MELKELKIKLDKNIKVKDGELCLTLEQARELKEILETLFSSNNAQWYPIYVDRPWYYRWHYWTVSVGNDSSPMFIDDSITIQST